LAIVIRTETPLRAGEDVAVPRISDLGDHVFHELGHPHRRTVRRRKPHLLTHDLELEFRRRGVVGADLRRIAVLQRRDDATAAGVVLRVRAGHDEHVDRQADAVALHLHIALFHDVEQAHLHLFRQVGKLVDAEDPAVRARQEAEVHRLLVGEGSPLGDLDRIDVADQIGDRDVGRGELFHITIVAVHPVDGRRIAALGDERARARRHRRRRVVVQLASGHHGHPLVEEPRELTDHARLRLPPLSEEDEIVATEQCILYGRHDGVVVAHHSVEDAHSRGETREQVHADLLAHFARRVARFEKRSESGRLRAALGHPALLQAGKPHYTAPAFYGPVSAACAPAARYAAG
jgi:hypothetical protein